jgi:hypothetical protein
MSQQELLRKLVDVLEEPRVPYMLTGSIASSLHGEPRSTDYLDVVVILDRNSIAQLLLAFPPPEYYLDEGRVRETIDFWMLTTNPFDKCRFARRTTVDFMARRLVASSPEDTILAKLNGARLSGGSEKQIHDALRIFEVQRERLDQTYLQEWAKRLSV